jgi:4-hydroxythreonine-4-phosphate dehydrogenase
MGDPNGIGPEIVARLLSCKTGYKDIIVIGNAKVLKSINKRFTNEIIDSFGNLQEFNKGRATAQNGQAEYSYVLKAVEIAKAGQIKAIVTAPLNKEALHLAGINMDGHTEILANATGTKNFGMMFYSPELCIMLTTIHKPLAQVPSLITAEKFSATLELALTGLKNLGIKKPRIGVCGLNPHAGEAGLFGREELDILIPVIKSYQAKGVAVSGPYPADTLFTPQHRKNFELIIAHYHDQGLIPLKMLAFDRAVNITVGLPIIRTSVDHGTAYDIVGRNKASLDSLVQAVAVARRLIRNKQ